MRKIVLIAVFAFVFGVLYYTQSLNAESTLIQVAGTIVNQNGKWVALNNSAHMSIGISDVVTGSAKIQINHKVGAKKVVTFIVTPDEALAKEGYRVGVSAGLDYSWVYIYKDGNLVDPRKCDVPAGNIWIYALLSK